MALNDIVLQQVNSLFTNILGPGGFTEEVTFRIYDEEGTFDVENDTFEPTYKDYPGVLAVVSKPGFDDAKNHGVIFTDAKLVIPGLGLVIDPDVDTDKVIRANGEEWDIRKVVGVPGRGALIVFIYRT